jgi:hypothetical protein
MPPRKKSATSELVKQSRELRRLAQKERQEARCWGRLPGVAAQLDRLNCAGKATNCCAKAGTFAIN